MEPTIISTNQAAESTSFMQKVYSWMAGGLLVTAITSAFVANSPTLIDFFLGNALVFYGLIIAELAIVFYLSWKVQSLATETASVLFFAYALLNGITLSLILLIYASTSIATAFLTTAGTFGLMSIYGATTKKDLTSMGSMAIMGLFGIIIASVVNLFLGNSDLEWTINVLGVIIFVALTAYDTQKIKEMRVPAVIGALHLYLDFINLFIKILQLGGRRR